MDRDPIVDDDGFAAGVDLFNLDWADFMGG
jgi:hypothetical protein